MELYSLKGQVAVVTGGSRGIGAAAVRAMAGDGAAVCILSRNLSQGKELAGEIRDAGGQALALAADVRNYAAMRDVMDYCVTQFGGIDILLLNAGVVLQREKLEESDPCLWADTVAVNLVGAYNSAHAAIPHLKKRGGKIITLGSGRGRRAAEDISDYACSKAGLWMLTRTLALELRPYHIAVNELVPGPVMTDMNGGWGDKSDSIFRSGEEHVKEPEDVIPLLRFLLAQSNGTGPTGQSFCLNRREI